MEMAWEMARMWTGVERAAGGEAEVCFGEFGGDGDGEAVERWEGAGTEGVCCGCGLGVLFERRAD